MRPSVPGRPLNVDLVGSPSPVKVEVNPLATAVSVIHSDVASMQVLDGAPGGLSRAEVPVQEFLGERKDGSGGRSVADPLDVQNGMCAAGTEALQHGNVFHAF